MNQARQLIAEYMSKQAWIGEDAFFEKEYCIFCEHEVRREHSFVFDLPLVFCKHADGCLVARMNALLAEADPA